MCAGCGPYKKHARSNVHNPALALALPPPTSSSHTAATADATARFKDLEADEAWKEANCKLCPHCGKTVYRVDGCSSMTCGRDAADKGGGNRQVRWMVQTRTIGRPTL